MLFQRIYHCVNNMMEEILNSLKKNIVCKELRKLYDIEYISGIIDGDELYLCSETIKCKSKTIIFNDYYGEGGGVNESNDGLEYYVQCKNPKIETLNLDIFLLQKINSSRYVEFMILPESFPINGKSFLEIVKSHIIINIQKNIHNSYNPLFIIEYLSKLELFETNNMLFNGHFEFDLNLDKDHVCGKIDYIFN